MSRYRYVGGGILKVQHIIQIRVLIISSSSFDGTSISMSQPNKMKYAI